MHETLPFIELTVERGSMRSLEPGQLDSLNAIGWTEFAYQSGGDEAKQKEILAEIAEEQAAAIQLGPVGKPHLTVH